MYFIPTGILLMRGAGFSGIQGIDPNVLGWLNFLWKNLLPVTLGNIIGGAVFVGMSYWGAYLRPVKTASAK
jgi:formate/nitrite transporter FocA (FNT family)